MVDSIAFDINQVIEIFTRRAEGGTHEAIGKAMGCSAGYIAKALSRENYGHYEIDPELERLAKEATIKRKPKTKRAAKKANAKVDPVKALTTYVKKAMELREAYTACIHAGLSREAVQAVYDALYGAGEPQGEEG
jgi:hypothetical protein